MAIGYGVPVPKGKTQKQVRAKARRKDAKQLREFRDAVWKHEWEGLYGETLPVGCVARVALCQHCHDVVSRLDDWPLTGEVHHRLSRRHKASRYNPDNGVLLCNHLVNNCHEKAERGLIDV